MRWKSFNFFLFLAFLAFTVEVFGQHGVSPAPYLVEVKQPDGTTLQIKGNGNPFYSWMETSDGYTVVRRDDGWYVYALAGQGALAPSEIIAKNPEERSSDSMQNLQSLQKSIRPPMSAETRELLRERSLQSGEAAAAVVGPMPKKGKIRIIALLVEYPDLPKKFKADDFQELFNGTGGEYQSFKEFYLENSFGNLDISVDIAGWYKASHNYEYYGKKNGYSRTRELLSEVVNAADADVDFSNYDNNNDGKVDGIILLHAGPGAEEGALDQYIWSHRSSMTSEEHDGVIVSDYCVNPERRDYYGRDNHMIGIGVLAHEFGHLFGLPDLYDTYQKSEGIGEWGLMGSGSWLGNENHPGGMCAWSREKMGWVTPEDITDSYGTYNLQPVVEEGKVYKIRTEKEAEYFLLENRTQIGIDSHLPGEGLAIWHINSDKATSSTLYYNEVNSDYKNKGIDLEEADGEDDLDNRRNRGDWDDLYPYYQNNAFDEESYPNSNYTDPKFKTESSGIEVEDIQYKNQVVTFTYRQTKPNGGETCENPIVAIVGENKTEAVPQWFSFTMPKAGSLRINTQSAGVPTSLKVYNACGNNTPTYTIKSANKGENINNLYIPHLENSQQVYFYWENQETDTEQVPFTWELTIETESIASADSLALVELYNVGGGKNWPNKANWLKGPLATWQGLTVENSRVTGLVLENANLINGELPASFYKLDSLKELQLSGKDSTVEKTIDSRIYNLKKLETLRLNFPTTFDLTKDLTSLSNLHELSLQFKKITGAIPANIADLSKLRILEIKGRSGDLGTIPTGIGDCINLEQIALYPVKGAIPISIGNLEKLTSLLLSNNKLAGAIPQEIGNLQKLKVLRLDHNQLSDKVPGGIFNLSELTTIDLSYNQLAELPENFFEGKNLNSINVSHNQIKGSLPKAIPDNLSGAMALNISYNQLSGTVTTDLSNLLFSSLNVAHNQLEGSFPKVVLQNKNSTLDISYNRFTALATMKFEENPQTFSCLHNQLSFDDIQANQQYFQCAGCEDGLNDELFSPQDTVAVNTVTIITEGQTAQIKLDVDNNVDNNQYVWFKDEEVVDTTNTNTLQVKDFGAEDSGKYDCEVTNDQISNLTLFYTGIQVSIKNRITQNLTISQVEDKTFGDPAFRITSSSDSGLPLSLEKVEGPVEVSGDSVSIHGTGLVVLSVFSAGNEEYLPVDSTVKFNIAKASQEIQLPEIADRPYAPSDTFTLNVSSTSDLPVALTHKQGNVTLEDNRIITQGTGNVVIEATQQGNENYLPAESKTITFNIVKASQTLAFDTLTDQTFGIPPIPLKASASTGLPVTFTVTQGKAHIVDTNYLAIDQVGLITVEASQPGNENYAAAPAVTQSFTVAKARQEIYFDTISTKTPDEPPFELVAFSSSDLAVSFEVVDGPATVTGKICTITGAGLVSIRATQAGNENYLPADPLIRSFQVSAPDKKDQIITVSTLPDSVQVGEKLALKIQTSSSLPTTVSIEGPAQYTNDSILFTAEGMISVKISQEGNDEYNPAPTFTANVYASEKVVKQQQSIALATLPDTVQVGNELTIDATTSSGLAPTFKITGPASISNQNQVKFNGKGTVKLTVNQAGNEQYLPAPEVSKTFIVKEKPVVVEPLKEQNLVAEGMPETLQFGADPEPIPVQTDAKLPLTYEVTGPGEAIEGLLHINGVGMVQIKVYQTGNDVYMPSDTITFSIEVLKADQTVSLSVAQQNDSTYQLNYSASSGLPVSVLVSGVEFRLEDEMLFVQENGEVTIQAYQPGNENYAPSDTAVQRFEVELLVTGIEDEKELAWTVYPNPSKDIFWLQLPEATKPGFECTLMDAKGKIVRKIDNLNSLAAIDLTQHAEGVYFLRIKQEEEVFWKRLIKK